MIEPALRKREPHHPLLRWAAGIEAQLVHLEPEHVRPRHRGRPEKRSGLRLLRLLIALLAYCRVGGAATNQRCNLAAPRVLL